MAVPDHSMDPKILESAKQEFLKSGYEKTKLNTICENAGVTTGALYKRYKGKSDLFCAVVKDTVLDLESVLSMRSNEDAGTLSDEMLLKIWAMEKEDMLWWFRFLYDRYDVLLLLLRCAQGTAYSDFQHDWVEKMTESTGVYLWELQRRGLARKDITKKEIHVVLSAFWTTIFEPFVHEFSWEEMEIHVDFMCGLFNWHKMFELKK